jgi:zinc and cadmium transporter
MSLTNFFWAIGSSVAISLISLVGIITFLFQDKLLDKILLLLIGFSAGALIGGAFLHLLPEALEQSCISNVFADTLLGFISFFILERYFYWRHCHEGKCDIHAFTYLNLIGDGIHNFSDGLVIGASFLVSIHFGVITTLVIIFHEIPQEIGDFGVLVYGGFSKSKALYYNFIIALTCVLGTIVGYLITANIKYLSAIILPVTAGGFIYIAACDLIPELHKEPNLKNSAYSMIAFICGILFVLAARMFFTH